MGSNFENEHDDFEADESRETIPDFSTPRLVEGVRDLLLRWFKEARAQKPWPQMSEADQKTWIGRIEERAEELVDQVIEHVNHGDFPVVNAKIDSFTVKNGEVKVVTKGYADNDMLAILNSAGEKRVQITVMQNDQFDQSRDPLNPDPDQPGLPGVKREPGFVDDDDRPFQAEPPVENPEDEQIQGEEVLQPKSSEWRGGFNSRMGGFARNQNPFNVGTQAEAYADWFAGWDAAEFDDKAPKVGSPAGEVTRTADEIAEAPKSKHFLEGGLAFRNKTALGDNPYTRKTMREDWEKGWLKASSDARAAGPAVEPDIEPEDDVPTDGQQGNADDLDPPSETEPSDDITDQDDVVIESEEQAHAFGMWSRRDGRGTGSNPFAPNSEFGKAWLRGYSDARKAEKPEDF